MFRGKESSNRIELSQLVQERLNFGVLGSLQLWGWGVVGGTPHMHAHACTHAHIHVKHDNFNCKWQPPLGESVGIPYDVIRTHVCGHTCMHMHVYMCGWHPPNHPHPHPPTPHPPPPRGDPWNQSKFNST